MKLSHWQMIMTLLFPARLPNIVLGLRTGFTVTLLGVLAGMFALKQGSGFLIVNVLPLLQSRGDHGGGVVVRLCSRCQRTSLVDGLSAASPV
jgi:hypothetical protein